MKKVYIVAFIVALMVGAATFLFAQSLENSTKKESADMVQVWVAKQDIKAGTMITTDMEGTILVSESVFEDALIPDAVRDLKQIMGQVIAQDLYAGEQISMKRIVSQGGDDAGLSYSLREGEVAYSIKAADERGVDGYILPGDTIDIMAAVTIEKEEDQKIKSVNDQLALADTLMLFENIEVLKVAKYQEVTEAKDNSESGDGEVKTYTSLTLRVTEAMAEELVKTEIALKDDERYLKFILNSRADAEKSKEEWANTAK